jgi:hypothetical protein
LDPEFAKLCLEAALHDGDFHVEQGIQGSFLFPRQRSIGSY